VVLSTSPTIETDLSIENFTTGADVQIMNLGAPLLGAGRLVRLWIGKVFDFTGGAGYIDYIQGANESSPTNTLALTIGTGSLSIRNNGQNGLTGNLVMTGSLTLGSPLSTTNGGTGRTDVGTVNQVLTSNGTSLVWQTPTTGTVTSVAASVPSFLSIAGSPITSTGTLAITYNAAVALPVANGGTGLLTIGGANTVLFSNGTVASWQTSTGTSTNVLSNLPTITRLTTTSTLTANEALTATNTFAGSNILYRMVAVNTPATGFTYGRFGVNDTIGNNMEQRFTYTASASALNYASFYVTANSRFQITNDDTAPFTVTNPSGPFAVTGIITSGSRIEITKTASANRKLVLFDTLNNDHQFYGLGIQTDTLRYQVFSATASHVFYAGTSTTTSTELFRVAGTGIVTIPATGSLSLGTPLAPTSGGTGLSAVGTAGQVLSSNGTSLVWALPSQTTTGTFTAVSVIVIPLPTTQSAKITISFVSTANTDLTLSGNTLITGAGTNLTVQEPYEQFQQASGISLFSALGRIATTNALTVPGLVEITILSSTLGTIPRKQFFTNGVYCLASVGSTRINTAGYLAITALSLIITPTTGTITGSWTIT